MWSQLLHCCVSFHCQADSGKWSKPNSSLKRPHSVLDPWPGLHALWPVSFVLLVHGIYRKQTATDGFLKIKCWLSTTDNLPQVCSWQQEMVNKHSELYKRGGICMLRLEDTTNAIIMPLTQHPSAGWWIPLIKDLWCCLLCLACTPSVQPI